MRDTHEIWKPIRETEGKYSVSNMGRVKNNETGTVLKANPIGRGYLKVNLHLKGMRVNRLVHRLVAIEFIDNPENKPEVNHKNGVHQDNRLCNLEWMTGEENRKHAYDTGLVKHKDDRYSGYLYNLWHRVHRNNMCPEWQEFLVFREWCISNGYEEGLNIARKDDSSEYSPDNCRITYKKQHSKTSLEKRKNVFLCFGMLMPIEDISEMFGMEKETLMYRIRKKGMTVEEAVSTPLYKKGRPRKEVICEQLTTKKNTTYE